MSPAQLEAMRSSQNLFVLGCLIGFFTCLVLFAFTFYEAFNRWRVEIGYSSGLLRGQPFKAFGVAFVTNKFRSMSAPLLLFMFTTTILMATFFGVASWRIHHLTSEQYFQRLIEIQEKRKS